MTSPIGTLLLSTLSPLVAVLSQLLGIDSIVASSAARMVITMLLY